MTKDKYYIKIALDNKRKQKERIIAIHQIQNQRVLYKIAIHEDNAKIRLEAVKEITNDNYLKSIARYDGKMQIRIAAVERIKDSYLLYKIAKSKKKYDYAVRRRAMELQRNTTYLKMLAEDKLSRDDDYVYIKM